MTKEEELSRYRQCCEAAKNFREQECLDAKWRRFVDLYRNHQHAGTVPGQDKLIINLVFSTVNIINASATVRYPKISVNPRKSEAALAAAITQNAVNYEWRHHDWQDHIRRAFKDSLLCGIGWVKVGYRLEQTRKVKKNPSKGTIQELIQEAHSIRNHFPWMGNNLDDDELTEEIKENGSAIVCDHALVERVSPFDVYVDPDADCMTNARFICQRILVPLEEARDNKLWNAAARKKLGSVTETKRKYQGGSGDFGRSRPDFAQDAGPNEGCTEWTEVFEYYDLDNATMSVFSSTGDGFLIDPMPMPFTFGHPFVPIFNHEVPGHFYPIGEVEIIESLQLELNKTRSQMINDRKRYRRKYIAYGSKFDEQARAALESDKEGAVVWIDDETIPLNQVITPMVSAPVDPDLYNVSALVQNDINEISGVTEYQRGGTSAVNRTATEAAILNDSAQARVAEKLGNVERLMREIAERVVMLMQQYMVRPKMLRITGVPPYPEMAELGSARNDVLFFEYQRDEIKGMFDFEVEAGSTQPQNESVKRQMAQQFASVAAPFVGTVIDPQKLFVWLAREGFGIENPEQLLAAGPGQVPGQPGVAQPGTAPGAGAPPVGGGQPVGGQQFPEPDIPPELLAQLGLG